VQRLDIGRVGIQQDPDCAARSRPRFGRREQPRADALATQVLGDCYFEDPAADIGLMNVDVGARAADRHVDEADNHVVDYSDQRGAIFGRHLGRKLLAVAIPPGKWFGVDLDEDLRIETRPVPRRLGQDASDRLDVGVERRSDFREYHGQSASQLQHMRYDLEGMADGTSGGSVPAQLRNAFLDLIENDAWGAQACHLAEQLTGCTDVLPFEHCEILDLPPGSTFAQAAHAVRITLGCPS
jgi:hypothetical protein